MTETALQIVTNVEAQAENGYTKGWIVPAGTTANLETEAVDHIEIPATEHEPIWWQGFRDEIAAAGYALIDIRQNGPTVTANVVKIPDWADYLVTIGEQRAAYLEKSGQHLGGMNIADLGDGRVALDENAVTALRRQPEDADGCISEDGGNLLLWIGGVDFPVKPVV